MNTRCAIYTRKSSEEGLDMAFNSLDAQREAGVDYVKSQRHEGWIAIETRYDDGGYSGGTTERPGLKKLMADIERGRVDVVLVYKVDRLSRSLADFARLMQTFDEHKVSFVSVTQQFNTTTSMGRLTLNMLLSFAQFEREIAGERIRDKIAATKRKGVWVCGQPPLGYHLEGSGDTRGLRIVPEEAVIIREIFAGYLDTGSLVALAATLRAKGYTTKRWRSSRGIAHGGRPLDSTQLYRTLNNPLYVGQISHTRAGKTEVYPGLHQAIIDRETWARVQAKMTTTEKDPRHRWVNAHLLKGKIRTFEGHAMSPSSVQRRAPADPSGLSSDAPGHKYRRPYYVSQKAIKQGYKACPIRFVSATALDDLTRAVVSQHLAAAHGILLERLPPEDRDLWIRQILTSVTVASDALTLVLDDATIQECIPAIRAARHQGATLTPGHALGSPDAAPLTCPFPVNTEHDGSRTVLTITAPIKMLSQRLRHVLPDGTVRGPAVAPRGCAAHDRIVRAIGLAYAWRHELLHNGETVETIARRYSYSTAHVHTLLGLT